MHWGHFECPPGDGNDVPEEKGQPQQTQLKIEQQKLIVGMRAHHSAKRRVLEIRARKDGVRTRARTQQGHFGRTARHEAPGLDTRSYGSHGIQADAVGLFEREIGTLLKLR